MQFVTWDYKLEGALLKFVANTPSDWFFTVGKYPGLKGNHSFNVMHLMEYSPLKELFPGYKYVMRDTLNDYANNVLFIIGFRLRQAHCINYNKCDQIKFTNFESCGQPLVLVPSQTCSWATQYYPRFIIESLNKFACVMLHIPGPFTPSHQSDSFVCVGNYTLPSNDLAYLPGFRGSKCDKASEQVYSGLCAPKLKA